LSAQKRVLVTGAGGFIGRSSLEPLRAAGYEVHAVHSKNRAFVATPPGVEVHGADLLDPNAVDALIEAIKPTHLLHFAWIATPGVYWNSAQNYDWLAASRHLLSCFGQRGGRRAVMAGSCAEYDWSKVAVCNERSSPLSGASGEMMSAYTECKIAMYRALEDFGRAHDVSTAWGRIFFQYGPGEHPQRLVASVIIALLSGREALCTHGRQIRSYLHVADVGAAFAAILDGTVEGPVNVGSGQRISIGELLLHVARHIGRPELLKLGARSAPASEPEILVPDIDRLRGEVGFSPRLTLDEGLADTIDWWRRNLRVGEGPLGGEAQRP
jgi:nucleoside-diphosphate-sugar epimerase